MSATTLEAILSDRDLSPVERLTDAATRLYDAEVALHVARQTKVDAWVAAAYDRLHVAVTAHRRALAALTATTALQAAHR